MTRMILAGIGTGGDVDPIVGLARVLQARGHAVTVAANGFFETLVRGAGLDFAKLGSAEIYLKLQADPDAWDAERSFVFALRELFLPQLRPLYRLIAERHVPGQTVVAAPPLAAGARMAHDKLGVPLASLLIQPCLLRSIHQTTGPLPDPPPPGRGTMLLRRFTYWVEDFWFMDRYLGTDLTEFRDELGLPSVRHHFREWCQSPQLRIGLFPEWFAPPPADWPPQLRLTGFPLYDESGVASMPAAAQQFLDAGEPPIAFTFGTGMRQAGAVFNESVAACRLLGRRGLLLTRYPQQLPANMPDSIRQVDYAPFSQLLPRVAALVHHGGIGTLSQALRAGIPQLVVPFAYDQPDNANRLERLGVARQVAPAEYHAETVTGVLRHLLESADIAARCRAYAARVRATRPLEAAARLIEGLA